MPEFNILQEMWTDLSPKEQFFFLENTKYNSRKQQRRVESKQDLPDLTDMIVFLGENCGGYGIRLAPNGEKFYVVMLIHGHILKDFASPKLIYSFFAACREKLKIMLGGEINEPVEARPKDIVMSQSNNELPYQPQI